MKRLLLGIIGLAALGYGLAIGATFDGTPATPLNIKDSPSYSTLDVQVHSRGVLSWETLPLVNAQHGADCSAPPASHPNTSYEGSVYICNNHVMTAINGDDGYAEIYLTPNLIFDFSNGGAVTFDISTADAAARDWWDVLISPWNQNLALPLRSDLSQGVDLQGSPLNAIQISTDNGEGAPRLHIVTNGVDSCPGPCGFIPSPGDGISGTVNQAATRQSFKITIANGRIKFERLASATAAHLTFIDEAVTLPFTSGIVQFGHHSYSPEKDGTPAQTWHWGNLDAQPSTPFTILHANERALFADGTVTFPAAPAGAYLRFSAICQVAVNGSFVTRQPAALQPYHAEHVSSYFVPIAEGSTSASIAFSDDPAGYGGPCHAKDFAVWSLGTVTGTPTVPPPTNTPANTSTPTSTATNTPTATSVPPTATAAPTRTPTPQTYRCQRRTANGTWTTVWTQQGGGSCP